MQIHRHLLMLMVALATVAGAVVTVPEPAEALAAGFAPFVGTCTGDTDCDGISDAAEEGYANYYMPTLVFDPEEKLLRPWRYDPTPGRVVQGEELEILWQVSPMTCSGSLVHNGGNDVLITYVIVYGYDYLPKDGDNFVHWGDTEKIQVCLSGGTGNMSPRWVRIFAHGDSRTHPTWDFDWCTARACGSPAGATHPVIWVSEGKHAGYPSYSDCVNSSGKLDDELGSWKWIPGVDTLAEKIWSESCGTGTVIIPRVSLDTNVGEWWRPNFTRLDERAEFDLLVQGSRTEYVWTGSAFGIGGEVPQNGRFCAGEQVLDPDAKRTVVTGYSDHMCAGGLDGKWHRPPMPATYLSTQTAYLELFEHSDTGGASYRFRPALGPKWMPSAQYIPDIDIHDEASYVAFMAPVGVNALICVDRQKGWNHRNAGGCLRLDGTGRLQGYDLATLFGGRFNDKVSSVYWVDSSGRPFRASAIWMWWPEYDRVPWSYFGLTGDPQYDDETLTSADLDSLAAGAADALVPIEAAPGETTADNWDPADPPADPPSDAGDEAGGGAGDEAGGGSPSEIDCILSGTCTGTAEPSGGSTFSDVAT
ncbi:MAG: hypothetical protein ACE5GB_12955, partial [Acidimicrobiales bacterium]